MREYKKEYNYDDIYLVPRECVVASRSECDTSVQFGYFRFEMPVFPSNMKSVVDEETCVFFAQRNWFYSMHRFGIDPASFTNFMHERDLFASISVGVNKDSYGALEKVKKQCTPPEYITIDIAHGWSEKMQKMIKYLKESFPKAFLIAGNVADANAASALKMWGADALRVGIAGGHVCITKNKTGFHRPMISSLEDCCGFGPIIADGGIRQHGDIPKAIACGATMVMAGSLFAAYDESAGEPAIGRPDGKTSALCKEYYGSASEHSKNKVSNIEGKRILIPVRGSMERLLAELKEDLQSSISYAGGKDLSALRWVERIIVPR
jgi:GMP reductase